MKAVPETTDIPVRPADPVSGFYSMATEGRMAKARAESEPAAVSPPYTHRSVSKRARPGLLTQVQILFLVTLGITDTICLGLGHYLAFLITRLGPEVVLGPFFEWLPFPLLHLPLVLGTFIWQHMYQRRRPISHLDETIRILFVNGILVLVVLAVLAMLLPDLDLYRRQVLYAWCFTSLLIAVGRILHTQIQWSAQSRGVGADRVLLVGRGETPRIILQKVRDTPKLGFFIVGAVSDGIKPGEFLDDVPVLGHLADIPALIHEHDIDEVIIGMPEAAHGDLVAIINSCEREKVGIRILPDLFQIMAQEVSIGDLAGLPLLTMRDVALQGWKLTLKRSIDIVFSILVLLFLSPLFLLGALLIKLESPGPVFYTQVRMGLDAIPFHMLKFRSMRADAEAGGPGWTTPDDPRRTRIGRFLRAKSLDELPNFINVLMNEMSIVGPRPERPVYVETFRQVVPNYMERHKEKGGITGWAQIHGLRGDSSIEERIKYDLWYIENWSIGLDLKIMAHTAWKILFRSRPDAY